jgi:plasmid stability protein
MANILVRDLPDEVHAALSRRAKREGQSLQQYLTRELSRLVDQPSVSELLDRVDQRQGGAVGLAQAVDDLTAERSRA